MTATYEAKIPMLSVIVPVYNTAPWLRRCLDSICAQTYRNLEILCVNDGSTDNSAEILEEYAAMDSRIKVFTQVNAGLSAARNTALEYATGEWVACVDSDDYIEPDLYERSVSRIEDGVDIVFYGVRLVAEDGTSLPSNPYFDLPEAGVYEMTPELGETLNVCFCSKLWRRSIFQTRQLRFPHGLVHEDYAMYYLYVPCARKVSMCPGSGYCYVQRSGSIMRAGQTERVTTMRYMDVLRFVYDRYREMNIDPLSAPWYPQAVSNVFVDRYYSEAPEMREELQMMFYTLLRKQNMLPVLSRDFRLRRIVPIRGKMRWFIRRNMSQEIGCFMGIPLFVATYKGAHRESFQWIIGGLILEKIKKFFRRFFQ